MNTKPLWRPCAVVALLGVTLVACSSSDGPDLSQVGTRATVTHIHGLGVDANETLFVATHNGLIERAASGWVYASADTNDYMGFSMHAADGAMYRSGHSLERPSLGVESSTDGATWTHLADVGDQPVDFHAMGVSFADSNVLWGWDYAQGTFRSTDGGRTWTRLELQGIDSQIYTFAGSPEPGVVYAGTMSGLYRSTDAGDTWSRIENAAFGWVAAIATDPTDPDHLLISSEQGIQVIGDGGTSWSPAAGGLPSDAQITSLAISPLDPDVAFAADSARIFKTTDNGRTWSQLPTT